MQAGVMLLKLLEFFLNNISAKNYISIHSNRLSLNIHIMHLKITNMGVLIRVLLSLCFVLTLFTRSRGMKWQAGSDSAWNITGNYEGSWRLDGSKDSNSRSLKMRKFSGKSVLQLISTPSRNNSVHYVQGMITFHDLFDNEHKVRGAQIKVEGVYIWPLRHLRLLAHRGKAGVSGHEDRYSLSHPYHSLGAFSSQVFQQSPLDKIWKTPVDDMVRHCNIQIEARILSVLPEKSDEDRYRYHIEGSMKSFSVDDNGDCLQPILLRATSVKTETYLIKAFKYNLMVTTISILQILLLIRQRKHSNTQSKTAKVSILAIGQQAIMDAFLCLVHLTAGITVEPLYNAFAVAAFFKFVVFFFFEMKYFLDIRKANRLTNMVGSLETRRESSDPSSRFYWILLGGILLGVMLIMYMLDKFLQFILLLVHSFWIPQIVTNFVHDLQKPLHPYFILGISVTRVAIPLYIFGCPQNFMHNKPDQDLCNCLVEFVGLQSLILLLQHYLGSGWSIYYLMCGLEYNYHKWSDEDIKHATDCVICMTAIDFSEPPMNCMMTPCYHFFHSECLLKWIDQKMDCPTCRHFLPRPELLDDL